MSEPNQGWRPGASPVPADTRVRPLGDRALIVDLPDLRAVLALLEALEPTRPVGIEDIVPAARTLAVLVDPKRLSIDTAHTWLERALRGSPASGVAASRGLDSAGGRSESRIDNAAGAPAEGRIDNAAGAPAERGTDNSADAPTERGTEASGVVIDVVYDGEDLAEVARVAGIPIDEIVRRHTTATWRVAFGGFAPGFGYLVTDDEWFDVPRRTTPRTRVPTGSVALAGTFSGVYPREGPGGWQLIGRTDAPLWRPRDARPALLTPGEVVRFRAVDALIPDALAPDPLAADPLAPDGKALTPVRQFDDVPHGNRDFLTAHREISGISRETSERVAGERAASQRDAAVRDAPVPPAVTVLRAGPQLLVEDLGRPGSASIGAGRSGALDRTALRLGNRLVGNAEGAAGLEVVLGTELRFEQPTWFAVTGARGALRLGGHPIEPDAAVHAAAGEVLQLGPAEFGLRYVVALRGGVVVPQELGSASADIGAGIGPAALLDGDTIALGTATAGGIPAVDALTVWPPSDDEIDVHVIAGPRQEWFAPASVAAFYDVAWEVTPESNRVGMRLRASDGPVLQRSADPALPSELPSEPMVPGAIQVPPSGEPTVLLADGPVTGGYPVIAVVTDAELDLFAQLRPGQRLRFRHSRAH